VTVPQVNALTVARSIEQAQRDYQDSVARGRHGAVSKGEVPDGGVSDSQESDLVRIRWVPLVVALLLVPAIAVAVLSLT
jgi:hypothetical protein